MNEASSDPESQAEEMARGWIAFDEIQSYRKPNPRRHLELFFILLVILLFGAAAWGAIMFPGYKNIILIVIGLSLINGFSTYYAGRQKQTGAKVQYLKNLETVRLLEAKYGSAVPWRAAPSEASPDAPGQSEETAP